MKRNYFSLFCALICFIPCTGLFAQKQLIPPGTVLVDENFYADVTEVSNKQYREFLFALLRDSGEAYCDQMHPDTTLFRNYNQYFFDVKYEAYPVVSVSFEQAQAFCAWRSATVTEELLAMPENEGKKIQIIYRLPSLHEWEKVARAKSEHSYYYFGDDQDEIISKNLINCRKEGEGEDKFNIQPVKSYKPSPLKIYNLHGNVAEMTSVKSRAKGGSWYHLVHACAFASVNTYEKPTAWLGFRCVAEIKKVY